MTTRISLAALLAVMAGAAFAQEPPASPPADRESAEHAVRSDGAEHDACSAGAGCDRADAGCSGAGRTRKLRLLRPPRPPT